VPTSRHTNDKPAEPTGNDPAARLREIRAKVTALQGRLKTERDPKLAAELKAEVKKLSALLSKLIRAAGRNPGPVAKAAPVVWPRDICTEASEPGEWGTDPAEVGLE
jgi:hypothetical protein